MDKKRKMISLSVDAEVYECLHRYAFEQHLSMASVLTQWVMKARVINDVSWRQQRLFDSNEN